jgi:hypothetical protein
MKKNIKKVSPDRKKQVQFLVQDFLEVDLSELEAVIDDENKIDHYWETLIAVLIGAEFWMDEIDQEEMRNINKRELTIEYHELLKPLWEQFKLHLLDYRNYIVPSRSKIKELRENIKDKNSTCYAKYKDLLKTSDIAIHEKFYDISLHIKVSFDIGNICFYKRKINIITNFLDLFKELPISLFSQCNHCEKFIVMTRSDKQYCPGCAAKKYQKDKWKNDPEGMRRKEKIRYHTERKPVK